MLEQGPTAFSIISEMRWEGSFMAHACNKLHAKFTAGMLHSSKLPRQNLRKMFLTSYQPLLRLADRK
jgi:hypothetical protein